MRKIVSLFLCLCLVQHGISKPTADTNDRDTCLEIAGQPVLNGKSMNGYYHVTLIHHNSIIDTVTLEANEAFDFHLAKNSIYAIRVEKKGFLPRLISINTSMPGENKKGQDHLFLFEVQMFRAELEKLVDDDDVDFPVAVITYDQKSNRYDYSRDYSESAVKHLEAMREETEKLLQNNGTNNLLSGRQFNQ